MKIIYEKRKTEKIFLFINKKKKDKLKSIIKIDISYDNILIYLIYFILILPTLIWSKKFIKRKISSNSIITIKIKGTGTQQILSRFYSNSLSSMKIDFKQCAFTSLPDIIYVNGNPQTVNIYASNLVDSINTIKMIWNNYLVDCSCMFADIKSITEVDLSNFDFSKVTSMRAMFINCSSLISIDLSNLDTTKLKDMHATFARCYLLKSINFNNFYTSSVTDMRALFFECNSLENLNLYTFDTSSVTDMYAMFYRCLSLRQLNLQNFYTSSCYNMEGTHH